MFNNKDDYKINLIFIIILYILLIPFFETMFKPLIKIFTDNTLSIKLVVFEIIKFSVVNIVLIKIKNKSLKKIIIFFSMLIYTLGYNILMFLLTILFQKNLDERKYKNIISLYLCIFIVMILYKYRMLVNVYEIKNYINILFILMEIFIIGIIFYVYKKGIINLDLSMEIIDFCIIGVMAYSIIVRDDGLYSSDFYNLKEFNFSIIAFIIMFLFYYFDISIYDEKTKLLLYILISYFIFCIIFICLIPYEIVCLFIISYSVYLVYKKYY